MTTKIIHIVIIGEYHCDPAPSWITRQILSEALAREQAFIYAEEEAPDSTLNSKIEGNKEFLKMNALVIEGNSLQVLFSKKLPRPCFQHTSLTSIAKLLSKKSSHENAVFGWMEGLKLHAVIPERLKLFQFLQEKEIPCHSIDIEKNMLEIMRQSSEQALALHEPRTRHMASNIVSICNSKFPDGGLLLVRVGTYHVPLLFLALKQELGQQKTMNYEFIIEGIQLESPYVDEILSKNRPFESKDMMDRFLPETANVPVSKEPCVENPDGSFTAPILSRLGASFYTPYHLPADNAVIRQQVQNVSGQIIKQLPNGGLLVNIHSAYLLASVRKNLGIERYRLKFAAEGKERMAYLEVHCPDITIERESENNCLVTFPKSSEGLEHLEIIRNDAKWRQHCDEVLAANSSTQLTMN